MRITRNDEGKQSWNRIVSFIGVVAMSIAFVKESAVNSLVWMDYVGYSIGMTVMYAPVLAVKLLKTWKGIKESENATPTA